jgi:predicted phosphodiesterase
VRLSVVHPELFGVTERGFTLVFDVEDAAGPVDAEARILVDGELRARSEGAGTRHVRVEGLDPATSHRVEIQVRGAEPPERHVYFPESVETLPAPEASEVASFATLNDLHFGEPRFGGFLQPDGEYGEDREGFPFVTEHDTEVPYWRFMNEDAVDEINASGVDAVVIKGDIADRGRPEQFREAARTFARFRMPHHAFLGNHDHYGLEEGLEVDGYALLGQPPAPRSVELGGWRLLLLDTVDPGHHHGILPDERLRWLEEALAETREESRPTLLFMHHQPVPPEHAESYPNTIGIRPEHSLRLFELIRRNAQVQGVLIGHTHRNRVRRYAASGEVPYIEVNCTKDYPGGWAHYRLYDDGSFRQEVRRTSSERALSHSSLCRGFFRGGYKLFALGELSTRSLVAGGTLGS